MTATNEEGVVLAWLKAEEAWKEGTPLDNAHPRRSLCGSRRYYAGHPIPEKNDYTGRLSTATKGHDLNQW